jgi:hypothetical protein
MESCYQLSVIGVILLHEVICNRPFTHIHYKTVMVWNARYWHLWFVTTEPELCPLTNKQTPWPLVHERTIPTDIMIYWNCTQNSFQLCYFHLRVMQSMTEVSSITPALMCFYNNHYTNQKYNVDFSIPHINLFFSLAQLHKQNE